MPGKNSKQQVKEIDEAQIVAWLDERPDFFSRHPGSLSAMRIPVDSGPAISLHQYQVRVLQDDKAQLGQKLGALLKNVKTNHKIHSDLLGLAGSMISLAREDAETEAYLALVKQHFALCSVKVFDKGSSEQAFDLLKSLVGKAESVCDNAIDEDLGKLLFGEEASRVLSMAVVPVKRGKEYSACLVLAADDKERFRSGMGGEFLKLLAQLLSSIVDDAGD